MKITQRSPEACYITIENQFGKYTFYIDNSTGEQIMKCRGRTRPSKTNT